MEFKKNKGETYEELLYRIGIAKNEEKLSWEEVAKIMNQILGSTYTESKYRKEFKKITKQSNLNINKNINNKNKNSKIKKQLKDYEKIKDEIKSERIKLQTCNIEKNRLDRQKARMELWYEQVGAYIKTIKPPIIKNINTTKTHKKYIQTLADIHMGANFISANNEYSPEIVNKRFETLKSKTINFIKEKGLTELTVIGLADAIQGVLRFNDLRINDSTVVKATVDVANLISTYLNDLSAYCKIIYYDVMYDNHSQQRYLGSSANAMMNEDLGYIIAHFIKAVLANNNRIKVILPKENDMYLEITNIFNFNIITCHGHQLKDINDAIKNLSQQRRKFYDYLIIGHFHNNKIITTGEAYCHDTEVLVAPSICGSDEYSDSLFKGSKSASVIYGFEETYGHTETYKIILN